MFSALTSLFSTLTQPRIAPSSWDPSTPLPAGSFKDIKQLKARITERSSLVIEAKGAWSHGTVRFEVVGGSGAAGGGAAFGGGGGAGGGGQGEGGLPSYDDAIQQLTSVNRTAQQEKREGGQFAEGETELCVTVEARWNDEEVWEESNVELEKVGGEEWRLSVQTPTMSPSRLASQLSYHITFHFPSSLPSLHSLSTSASQWRHLGSPSLSSLHFHHLSLVTTNAPLNFPHLSAGETTLKTANATVEGSYVVDSLTLRTENGKISGTYAVAHVGRIRTSNRPIEGNFAAEDLEVQTSNGKIEGTFEGRERLKIETVNGRIGGRFRAGGQVGFKTCNAVIEGDIEVLGSGEGGERESTPDLLAEDVKKTGQSSSDGAEGAGPKIVGEAKTANAIIDLRFLDPPKGTEVQFEAKSANGRVKVAYPAPFEGSFHASTSNGSALITVPTSHTISYDGETKGKRVTGRVSSGGDEGSKGSFKVESSNAEVGIRIV
ncbi:hypothetical protein BCR35DRAFT_304774 [Leucosporidium creatinivorum]|uniref:Adhesin domain-containing protein n=1 Tax=Leucosporidium creatinivorum TaxID=106004 RepID=A0A1Y2F622_9BASI|nr:hypothetical protein BCR35DRAFT_304774 [Leucosporidium creatinivorum]